jgi:hypothetical protein
MATHVQVDVGLALLTWLDFTRFDLIALHWSPVKPSLFFALDAVTLPTLTVRMHAPSPTP